MDVACLEVILQALGDSPILPAPLGDSCMQQWSDLADGAAIEPSVLPEFGAVAIAYRPVGAGEEESALVGGELKVKTTPCAGIIGSAEPEPAKPKCQSSALQIMDSQPSQGNGASDATPVYVAVATVGFGATSPKEAMLDLLEHLQDFLGRCQHKQLVQRDSAEHRFDQR